MKIQVLVTTMHQHNLSIYEKMNLKSYAVIANQADTSDLICEKRNGASALMVSTLTRGLSRNRNIAIAHSFQNIDLILFSDDDLVFNEDYEQLIIDEFNAHPEAEAIKFNIHDISETRRISMKRINKFEKATRKNISASGVCGLVIKKDLLIQKDLHFNEYFGAGTENFCGEDTIFLQSMINKGIKFYRSPKDIAGIDQSKSSWFGGYNSKYFEVAGKVFATVYPKFCGLLAIRSSYRFSKNKNCNMTFFDILKNYNSGIRKIKGKK